MSQLKGATPETRRDPDGGGGDPERLSFLANIGLKVKKMTDKKYRLFEPVCQGLVNR